METTMGTTSKMYAAHRGNFKYVATWELAAPVLKWTAVVMGPDNFSKLLVGQLDVGRSRGGVAERVRREVEERIDLQAWLKD